MNRKETLDDIWARANNAESLTQRQVLRDQMISAITVNNGSVRWVTDLINLHTDESMMNTKAVY